MEPDRIAELDQAQAAYKDHANVSAAYFKALKANGLSWWEAAAVVGFWLAGLTHNGQSKED